MIAVSNMDSSVDHALTQQSTSTKPCHITSSRPDREPATIDRTGKPRGFFMKNIDPDTMADVEAEKAVLGCISMGGGEWVSKAAASLNEDHFHDPLNQHIFSAYVAINSTDQVLLLDHLRKKLGKLFNAGDVISRLDETSNLTPSSTNMPFYANILKDFERKRSLKAACHIALQTLRDEGDYDDAAATMDTHLSESREEKECERTTKDVVLRAMDQIESWQTHEGVVIGVPTGFSDLDLLTGGIQPGDMFVLAARPSVGKTAIGLNIATTASMSHGKGVIFFSLEMSSESLAIRMMSSLAEVPSHRMRQKSLLSKAEIERLTVSSARISKAPIKFFDDPGMNLYQIKAAARGWCKNNDVELMVVDYLQLVSVPGTKNNQRWQQVSEISSGLKALARELNVAILVLAQLNRDPERDNRTPRMSDLRESGSIEQDADCVALLHRADPEDDLVNLVLDKQRNGPTGMVPLLFRRSINKFVQSAVLPE